MDDHMKSPCLDVALRQLTIRFAKAVGVNQESTRHGSKWAVFWVATLARSPETAAEWFLIAAVTAGDEAMIGSLLSIVSHFQWVDLARP